MSLSNKKFGNRADAARKAARLTRRNIFRFMQNLASTGKSRSEEMQLACLDYGDTYMERRVKTLRQLARAYI